MSETIQIEVLGEATGKGRPRMTRSGHVYSPPKTVRAEAKLAYAAQQAMDGRSPLTGAVRLDVAIDVQIPASWSRRRRAEALTGHLAPVTKPDLDNTLKLVCDAFSGVVFADDRQVVQLIASKHYAESGRMVISVVGETP